MNFQRIKTTWQKPASDMPDMPNYLDTIFRDGQERLMKKVNEEIIRTLEKCGYGKLSYSEFLHFAKSRITMLNFESGELSEIWVDYGTDEAALICTCENKFDVEINEGKIFYTFK